MHRLLLCCLVLPVWIFAQNPKVKPTFSVRIIVTDSLSGLPLEKASLRLNRHKDIHLTDAQGVAVFDSLTSGRQFIQCTFVGYHAHEQFIRISPGQTIIIRMCEESLHLHAFELTDQTGKPMTDLTLQNKSILEFSRIQKRMGQNLGDLLKPLNGVTLLNTGPTLSKPVIRGLHSNRIIMLNNGVKQEGQQWGAEHGPEIDPFTINRLELIRGASSVEFGPEALGGVIKLSSRPFRTKAGMGGFVTGTLLSNNRQGGLSALLEGSPLKLPSFRWNMQGTIRKAGDAQTPGYVISNTGFEELDGNAGAEMNYRKLTLTGRMSVFNARLGIMRAAHIGNTTDLLRAMQASQPLYMKPFTYAIANPYQLVWHEVQSLQLRYVLNSRHALNLFTSRQLNERQEFDLGVSWNTSSGATDKPAYDLVLKTYQSELTWEHRISKSWSGKSGAGLSYQSNVTGGTQSPIIPNFIAQSMHAFLIEKYARGRFQAEAGIRADYREQTAYFRNKSNSIIRDYRSFQSSTLIAGSRYQLSSQTGIYASASSGWRPPSMNELYSHGLHNGAAAFEIGDSNLLREKNLNLEIGIKHQTNKWFIEGSFYRNMIYDYIYLYPSLQPTITLRGTFPTFQFTQTDALLQGIELHGAYNVTSHLIFGIKANYLHASELHTREPLIFIPANRISGDLNYHHAGTKVFQNLFFETEGIYVAHQFRYPVGVDYLPPPSAYFLLNVNAGFEIPVKQDAISVSFGIQNLLNRSYRDYMNRFRYFTDETGINFMLRFMIPFQILTVKN
ncbi:MAG: TonB-dependent receptor [Bacteroidia bacterium]|jgi:iron complex outermembrane receptor protein